MEEDVKHFCMQCPAEKSAGFFVYPFSEPMNLMDDRFFMQRAIELAYKGEGRTNPNPMVGCVIVRGGRIISEDYHHEYGHFHAERNALLKCADAGGATAYVTLEPCCHFGKTPPCTEILIEKKVKRVVIGSRDPNPLVSGKGAKLLREAGIEVVEDFMRDECDAVNPVFFHYITTGLPYTVMKYAMTLDGKIATYSGKSRWITGEKAREHVHTLRNKYAAIMVGIGTVLADDPMLNCRIPDGKDPLRVICDTHLKIPPESNIVKTSKEIPTVIFCAAVNSENAQKAGKLEAAGIRIIEVSTDEIGSMVNLYEVIKKLGELKIDSVLIEGGGQIHESALRAGIVNHVCAYVALKVFGSLKAKTPVGGRGVEDPADAAVFTNAKITPLGEDFLIEADIKGGMEGVYRNC